MFCAEIWKILDFFFSSENYPFLVVKFLIYLNRHVFVMPIVHTKFILKSGLTLTFLLEWNLFCKGGKTILTALLPLRVYIFSLSDPKIGPLNRGDCLIQVLWQVWLYYVTVYQRKEKFFSHFIYSKHTREPDKHTKAPKSHVESHSRLRFISFAIKPI